VGVALLEAETLEQRAQQFLRAPAAMSFSVRHRVEMARLHLSVDRAAVSRVKVAMPALPAASVQVPQGASNLRAAMAARPMALLQQPQAVQALFGEVKAERGHYLPPERLERMLF
jgi:hypothetical protein